MVFAFVTTFRYNSIRKRLLRRLYFRRPSCRPCSDLMKESESRSLQSLQYESVAVRKVKI